MPINETLAQYSDWAFESAFAVLGRWRSCC